MSKYHKVYVCFVFSVFGLNAALAAPNRDEIVQAAKSLGEYKKTELDINDDAFINPFFIVKEKKNPVRVGLPDQEILREIINAWRVTGVMTIRGVPTLFSGEKRIIAGDIVNVNYNGTIYPVKVTNVDALGFELEYKNCKESRKIKNR